MKMVRSYKKTKWKDCKERSLKGDVKRLVGMLEGISHKVAVYAELAGMVLSIALKIVYDLTKARGPNDKRTE
ncbi:unnamed protein product [Auanema sp. JU1783]|nr:unnamed protein product [Auanema sp. JU1783]